MLKLLSKTSACSLYEIDESNSSAVRRLIASTPETRKICNDPAVVGLEYTEGLKLASAATLKQLSQTNYFHLNEEETTVLHILRGGLNFGLREALYQAFDWNRHTSSFLSAQRERTRTDPEHWQITERDYQKVYLPPIASVIFGDVVATGTSLQYAVEQLLSHVEREQCRLRSVVFLTIGGSRAEEIIANLDEYCRSHFPEYQASAVIYFEGRFAVADSETPLSIKLTGTDLIRCNSMIAPEFLDSQYEDPAYPLERCVICDAGSRAYWLPEYNEDVRGYWEQTLELANGGLSYDRLIAERFPEFSPGPLSGSDLKTICKRQIKKFS